MTTPSSITDMVKNYIAANGTARKKEARKSLKLDTEQIKRAFDNLVRSGSIKRIGHGLYQFQVEVEKPGNKGVDKIWKAMKISSSFSASEIAKLAGSTRAYVYKRFRVYRADKYIKQAGRRHTHGSGSEKLYRLTLKGKKKAQNPNIKTFKPDPLVMAAVNLNRLICSGLAVRSRESADQALIFVKQIKNGLEDVVAS